MPTLAGGLGAVGAAHEPLDAWPPVRGLRARAWGRAVSVSSYGGYSSGYVPFPLCPLPAGRCRCVRANACPACCARV